MRLVSELSRRNMSLESAKSDRSPAPGLLAEIRAAWQQMPDRGVFLCLLAAWVILFQFLGNSTLGYVNSPSIFRWWKWTMDGTADQEIAYIMPLITLVMLWLRRDTLLALDKRVWWPALALLGAALALHTVGFLVQQTRISVVGFFLGIYGMTGLLWGAGWLRAAVFPFALLIFCVPLGPAADPITVPLRLLATKLTAVLCDTVLGINVIHEGNRLSNAAGTYQYEVAAVCSGIKSLTTIVAFGVIYAYLSFKTFWRRVIIVALAVPMAVAANVCRLSMIIVASETFSPQAGNYIHDSSWLSLLPYIPAFGGMMLAGWWLRENRKPKAPPALPPSALLARAQPKP